MSATEMFLRFDADLQQQVEAGERRGARSRAHELDLADVLADDLQAVEDAGGDDDGGAMLVVVEHGDIEQRFQRLLDDEAIGGLDVFEVDAAERRPEVAHAIDEGLDVLGIDEEIDGIDVGEALEQRRLAFHHGLCRQRAEIAEAEDRGAVGDDGNEVALARI